VVRDYAAELLSRQDVSNMLDLLKENNPTVVEELIPNILTVGVVHRVLQCLLEEEVPIHDFPAILETLADYGGQTKDPIILAEFGRQALKGHIIAQFVADDRTLYAMTLDPILEQEIQESINQGSGGGVMSLPPEKAMRIVEAIKNMYERLCEQIDADIVLIVSPLIRLHMFRMVSRKCEGLPVLSYSEITDDVPLQILGSARIEENQ
jgi:flagellar biosynthesis protein FlhA